MKNCNEEKTLTPITGIVQPIYYVGVSQREKERLNDVWKRMGPES